MFEKLVTFYRSARTLAASRLCLSVMTGAILAMLSPLSAYAQMHPQSSRESHSYFIVADSTARSILNDNAPAEFNLPGNNRFAIVGQNRNFILTVGGYAKFTMSEDLGNVMDNPNEFTTANIPVGKTDNGHSLFQASAMQSHLCLNFVALPQSKNEVGIFVAGNFLDNYIPELQFAYVRWRGLLAGYDYTIFSDPAAGVPTIDYEGPSGFTAMPVAQISYSHKFGKNKQWTAGAGVEMPFYSVTTNGMTKSLNQGVPDIPAFIRYSFNDGQSWIRLSGVLRNLTYRDEFKGKDRDVIGWGFNLSGSSPIGSNLVAYWQGTVGKGIASRFQDVDGLGLDLVPSVNREGRLNPVFAWGGYVGLQYNFSPKVFTSATYSHVRTYASDYGNGSTPWGEQYRYAQYAVGNIFWQCTGMIQTGLEYIYGRRVNYDGTQGHDNRIQAMIQINF